MSTHQPEIVFHAAAHKHVPLMEASPDEAILNNVGGTMIVAAASLRHGVARFVNISSDKAVNPVSMVGVTKSIAERVVRAYARRAGALQAFVSVRFGNVLGSRSSVVPLFQEQIRRGGPVTLTHPDMTRYFMTIPEASRLVIQAAALGTNGAVYVLDMGDPVRIEDLARDMIRLSGADPDEIGIVFTGIRPGEKISEELFTAQEQLTASRAQQIMVARPPEENGEEVLAAAGELLRASRSRDRKRTEEILRTLEPGSGAADRGILARAG
jgi:FlaA1/EpsC-like NDP-sugar epimerase